MRTHYLLVTLLLSAAASGATFGTAVSVVGAATDIALDETRGNLYVVNSTQNRIDVYATAQKRYLSPIAVGQQPLSAAMSRDGKSLYITGYGTSTLEVIDLDHSVVSRRVPLPAAPEGVAGAPHRRVAHHP